MEAVTLGAVAHICAWGPPLKNAVSDSQIESWGPQTRAHLGQVAPVPLGTFGPTPILPSARHLHT